MLAVWQGHCVLFSCFQLHFAEIVAIKKILMKLEPIPGYTLKHLWALYWLKGQFILLCLIYAGRYSVRFVFRLRVTTWPNPRLCTVEGNQATRRKTQAGNAFSVTVVVVCHAVTCRFRFWSVAHKAMAQATRLHCTLRHQYETEVWTDRKLI